MASSGEGKVRPIEFAHVNFNTPRLEEMKEWYLAVLEGEVVFANENYAFLSYDHDFHRIALVRNPRLRDKSGEEANADHPAFLYARLEDLLHTYERLKKIAIMPIRAINHGPSISLYYRDPDGNRVELQVNRFRTMAEIREYLKDGTFAADPIGVDFDVEKFGERLRAGASAGDLFRMTYAGELS